MRKRLPMLMLIAVTLLVAGCGGSKGGSSTAASSTSSAATPSTSATSQVGSTSSGSGKPLPASQLIAKADAICAQLTTELDKDHIVTRQDIIRVVPHRVAVEQAALTELSKLTPPASIARDYRRMLAARQTLIEDTKKLGEDVAANNRKAQAPVYVSSSAVVLKMAATAHHAGFKYCGRLG